MNRNVESHFSELPKIDIGRSTFDRSASHKTSFNVGYLIPFFVDEVLPGDTFKVTTSAIVRLQTLLTPIMDNMYMDTYYFFVPNRIVWTHWKEFMGENTTSAWLPQTEYTIPRMNPPSTGWNVGTIADYMGIPTGVATTTQIAAPMSLPFRAYAMICDQWFRDQNLSDPINITLGDSNTNGSNGSNYITDVEKGGIPFKVAKYHDYFTSSTRAPQKGLNVGLTNTYVNDIPVNFKMAGPAWAPVYSRDEQIAFDQYHPWKGTTMKTWSGSTPTEIKYASNEGAEGNRPLYLTNDTSDRVELGISNLWADIGLANITINDLRLAFQLQKYFEKNARAGTRYREIIKEHFGVTTSDARMMIPEYLGGHRFPLSIHQVANTTSGQNEFLGDLGAMSNTSDIHEDFVRSFEEHGFVIGVCCVRYDHSYPQGLERFWMRDKRLSFYYPVFANIGEQAVMKREIYWSDESNYSGNIVFGYQEAWAEYRYKPNRVSGEMRPGITNSLATWHLADYYNSVPSLSDSWIREDENTVDRVLSVNHNTAHQVFCDFYVNNIVTRPMPMYSIPGLIDHH